MKTLKLLRLGAGERLERLLCRALAGVPAEAATLTDAECGLDGSRILFALHIDEYGAEESLHTLLRTLRRSPGPSGAASSLGPRSSRRALASRSVSPSQRLSSSFII